MLDRIARFILHKTGERLHLPSLELYLGAVQTLDGKVIQDTGMRRAHSWNRNAYNNLFTVVAGTNRDGSGFGAGSLASKNTSGTTVGGSMTIVMGGSATIGITTSGILLGTNNTAETFEDFKINSLIASGMEAGQISYGESFYSRAGTLTVTLKRYFNNNSGGTIQIGEIAFYPTSAYMFSREAYSTKLNFLDKAQLQVSYQFSLTYPT